MHIFSIFKIFLLTLLSCTMYASSISNFEQKTTPEMMKESYCTQVKNDRVHNINQNENLHALNTNLSTDTDCFSHTENLLFLAHLEAELRLKPFNNWLDKQANISLEEAKMYCQSLIKQNITSQPLQECINHKFNSLMLSLKKKLNTEKQNYIIQRKKMATYLIQRCRFSFNKNKNKLPKNQLFPIIMHNKRALSIPNWYITKKLKYINTLNEIDNITISDIAYELLNNDCPGDMYLWITPF